MRKMKNAIFLPWFIVFFYLKEKEENQWFSFPL